MTRGRYGFSGRLIVALLLLTSAFGIPADAQEVQGTLTLDDAVRLAVRNNPGFLQTANDESVADWAYQESWG